ncbi:hypothetical protein BUZ08_00025 [Staphylococcus gallinarum]|uniref:hypothetical protein n=1 Tax=Staphylococcus gallinarum TaxID=1293 RepID=UPI000D1FC234|nr:hypothetical protein [Staphylococcus gallinarum]MCD8786502.1 hypothetical protein [Staphylococcus gallinarum]MCD8859454.1 hypothetical protein [Staphylococcus gallinarum]PTL18579.1 hypothetical protein BUZ08_00025 [Staphylococcus gallinarum]RIO77506.1 hypothetical protein BUZ07_11750 [Staphylococcus gallinarum]
MKNSDLFKDLNDPQQFKQHGIRQMMRENDEYESTDTDKSSHKIIPIILALLIIITITLITFFIFL